jgi:hypothetical protein
VLLGSGVPMRLISVFFSLFILSNSVFASNDFVILDKKPDKALYINSKINFRVEFYDEDEMRGRNFRYDPSEMRISHADNNSIDIYPLLYIHPVNSESSGSESSSQKVQVRKMKRF